MSKSRLALVPPETDARTFVADTDTRVERIARLQAEAKALAHTHVEAFADILAKAAVMSREIADGGAAYPVGARELAERLAQQLPAQSLTLQAITARASA